jgi:ferredoxin
MIVGEQKPFEEIWAMVARHKRVLVAGCGTCMTVCFAGGEKEVGALASMLRMRAKTENHPVEILETTIKRQCDPEFLAELAPLVAKVDAVLSIGCGAGIQFIAERYPSPVLPGINTRFIGVTPEHGEWVERCAACGDCVLDRTGGVCPVARCAKRIHNGPCGGSHGGKCEVEGDRACAWQLIVDRLKALGKIDAFDEITPPRDWRKHRDGGQRKVVREDLRDPAKAPAAKAPAAKG